MKSPDFEIRRLPQLPPGFWRLCGQISESCEGLLLLLRKEWHVLQKAELVQLWKISEEKIRTVDRIKALEQTLNSAVDEILTRCGVETGGSRWSRLLTLLNDKDVERMQSWLAQMRILRKEIFEVNKRHMKWLGSQIELVQQLTGILSGKASQRPSVYSPKGRLAHGISGIFQRTEVL